MTTSGARMTRARMRRREKEYLEAIGLTRDDG